jgi:hypothetical protein
MSLNLIRNLLVLGGSMGCCVVWAASPVTELKAQDLAAFVAGHEHVVVQFTSSDRKCGYCIDADKTFDQAAGLRPGRPIAFARVQWSPWRAIPDFGPLLKVYGVPGQFVFRKGKVLAATGGRPQNAPSLVARIDAIMQAPAAPAPEASAGAAADIPASSTPGATAMSADEVALTRLGIRHDFFEALTSACAKLFPDHAKGYRESFLAWRGPRQTALDDSAKLMLTRTSRDDSREMTKLVDSEKKTLQAWQTTQLGISMKQAPRAADCAKIAKNMAALP